MTKPNKLIQNVSILIIFLLLSSSQLLAQKNSKIDSLRNLLTQVIHDSLRVQLQIELGRAYLSSSPDKALEWYKNARRQAAHTFPFTSSEYKKCNARIMQRESWVYGIYLGRYDTALVLINQALVFAQEAQDKAIIADSYNTLGTIYSLQGDFDSSLIAYEKALAMHTELGNRKRMAATYNNIGTVYDNRGDYAKAVDYYQKALRIYEKQGDKKNASYNYHNIGALYNLLDDLDQAIEYYQKALDIQQAMGDKIALAAGYTNIGDIYLAKEDYAQALAYSEKSLDIQEELGDKAGMASNYGYIGDIYLSKEEYIQAEVFYQKAIELSREIGNRLYIANSLHNLARIKIRLKEYPQAIQYAEECLEIAQELEALDFIDWSYTDLAESYEALNDPQNALKYYKQHEQIKDSILSREKTKIFTEMVTKYETEKKEQEIEKQQIILDKQQAEIKAKNLHERYFIGVIIGIALFLGLVSYFLHQRNRANHILSEQKEEINEKNEELITSQEELQQNMEELQATQEVLESQKNMLELQNQQIVRSIRYAETIQKAILPSQDKIEKIFPNSFLIFRPKDIVSGDFFWFSEHKRRRLVAAIDCTGHGVPGAFMSLVGNDVLSEIIMQHNIIDPATILFYLNREIRKKLNQAQGANNDGMDAGFCLIEPHLEKEGYHKITFAGAKNQLFIVENNQVQEIRGDRKFIGGTKVDDNQEFTTHERILGPSCMIYMLTDGYIDQADPNRKRFSSKRLKVLMEEVGHYPTDQQEKIFIESLDQHQRQARQRDDITLIGIQL